MIDCVSTNQTFAAYHVFNECDNEDIEVDY